MVGTRSKRGTVTNATFEEAIADSQPKTQKKVRSSSFALTVNTNQKYKTYDAMVADLRTIFNASRNFFADVNNVGAIVELSLIHI